MLLKMDSLSLFEEYGIRKPMLIWHITVEETENQQKH